MRLSRGWLCMVALVLSVVAGGGSAGASPAHRSVDATFSAPGPFRTVTTTVRAPGPSGSGYVIVRPRRYRSLGFKSPIVTWGNGTKAIPAMYSVLLGHLASYGFTVIATDLTNTGSGREIAAAARYLIHADSTKGSVFEGRLNVHEVAAVGHSQGATGAVRVATMDPALISSVMTFSLPSSVWSFANPDCPVVADCEQDAARLTRPAFFIATRGLIDAIIASPSTERADFDSVRRHAVLGMITRSGHGAADHNSVQNPASGGDPAGELGYATAWLEYTLRGSRVAARAFTGPHPELVADPDWQGSAVK